MLKKGFLAGPSVYSTNAYSEDILMKYRDATSSVFEMINYHNSKGNLKDKLEGPVVEKGFKRLN